MEKNYLTLKKKNMFSAFCFRQKRNIYYNDNVLSCLFG